MSIMFPLRAGGVLAVICSVCLSVAWGRTEDASSERIAVEIWRHGDIGSTVKFADVVEDAIYESVRFRRTAGKKPGTLVVSIPRTVEQVEIANRVQSWYYVEFTTVDGKKLGTSSGACWTDELLECAKRVRSDAELAALRMRSNLGMPSK